MSRERLWTWALRVYAAPGVAPALLRLQDEGGQNVPLLLWAAWARPTPEILQQGAALARSWDAAAVAGLRQVRRGLKSPPGGMDAAAVEILRQQVKAAELLGERLLLEALEALAAPAETASPLDLRPAARAWSPGGPPDTSEAEAALERARGRAP